MRIRCDQGVDPVHFSWILVQGTFLHTCAMVADMSDNQLRSVAITTYTQAILDKNKFADNFDTSVDIPCLRRGELRPTARIRTSNYNGAAGATSSWVFSPMLTKVEKKRAHLRTWLNRIDGDLRQNYEARRLARHTLTRARDLLENNGI